MILETKDVQCGTNQPLVAFGRFKRVATDTLLQFKAKTVSVENGSFTKI